MVRNSRVLLLCVCVCWSVIVSAPHLMSDGHNVPESVLKKKKRLTEMNIF